LCDILKGKEAIYLFFKPTKKIMKQGYTILKMQVLFLFLLISYGAYSQQVDVAGKVTDSGDGSPLPGVSIFIKGTTDGTVTDVMGNYSISVPTSSILVFSYIGYETQ